MGKLSRCFVQLIPISVPVMPPSRHRCYENPQARLYPHITLHSESSAAQIGTAFILVSHVEATQAAGRARRDMREFYSKWARVLEGIKLNPTAPTSPL